MDPLSCVDSWPQGRRGVVIRARADDGSETVTHAVGDLTTALAWASVTKVATALCVHVCCAEGLVALGDQVAANGATLAEVLAHAGGFGPTSGPPVAAPGRRRIYSNVGYDVAAAHVERATGLAFETLLIERVLAPLSMVGTTLEGSPASGLVGPVGDLGRLLDELLEPTLLDRSDAAAMSAVVRPGIAGVLPGFGRFDPCDWGSGPEVKGDKPTHWTGPSWGPATMGHFGQAGGFVVVDPTRRLGVATLADQAFGPWAVDAWPRFLEAVWASFSDDPG